MEQKGFKINVGGSNCDHLGLPETAELPPQLNFCSCHTPHACRKWFTQTVKQMFSFVTYKFNHLSKLKIIF